MELQDIILNLEGKGFQVEVVDTYNNHTCLQVSKVNGIGCGKLIYNTKKNEIVAVTKQPRISLLTTIDDAIDFFGKYLHV